MKPARAQAHKFDSYNTTTVSELSSYVEQYGVACVCNTFVYPCESALHCEGVCVCVSGNKVCI